MNQWRLVADIGGTNLRMARAQFDGRIHDAVSKTLNDCLPLVEELKTFATEFGLAGLADVALAAAGPVDGRRATLTNRNLDVDADAVSAALGGVDVALLNDLQAVALALPWLAHDDLRPMVAAKQELPGPRLVVNVGTGFGASLLVPIAGGWHAIACEPGHMTLLRASPTIAQGVRRKITVEDLLSGMTVHDAQASRRVWNREPTATQAATFGTEDSPQFVSAFSALLGEVCGNLVLACGAWGGAYLIGSVASQWCTYADLNAFTNGFRSKGPMTSRMSRVGVSEIRAQNSSLIGLAKFGR